MSVSTTTTPISDSRASCVERVEQPFEPLAPVVVAEVVETGLLAAPARRDVDAARIAQDVDAMADLETSQAFSELIDQITSLRREVRGPGRDVDARGLQVDLLDPAGRARHLRVGRHRTVRGSSTSSGRTRNGAATTRTPSTSTRRSIRRARIASAASAATPSICRSPSTADRTTAAGRTASSGRSTTVTSTFDDGRQLRAHDQPGRSEPGAWLKLEPDAVAAITRDYIAEPDVGRRTEWHIEAVDPPADAADDRRATSRAGSARRQDVRRGPGADLPAAATGSPNTMDAPYPVPQQTFGWAAGDAAYAMGRFELGPGEALELSRPFTGVCVLEHGAVEPVPAHLRLRVRPRRDQRGAGHLRRRRLLDDRHRAARPRPSELGLDARTPQGIHLVPVVPAVEQRPTRSTSGWSRSSTSAR